MATQKTDPTEPMREMAAAFPDVLEGTACNQSGFKTKKGAFLYVGPGAKGQGFKAMFRLERSQDQAAEFAAEQPDRFEVGTGQWVTARFTAEKPLRKTIWSKRPKESYGLMSEAGATSKKSTAPRKGASARPKSARKR